MNAMGALRKIEEGLISRRQIATVDHAFEEYRAEVLPPGAPPTIQQGWDAGWAACMRSVTRLVTEVQTEVLRAPKGAAEEEA